ncbi:MFS transporter [Cryptosporangium arvum]|uniref:MFS transporter n=1 Tax=Cryptosporangium arvum TaxID=80871 RepID=UPI0004B41F5D|nr:MFS transporter [Cryptosporangium arvum]
MPELSRRHRLAVLATCCLALFLVGLDNTIVNVALPSLGRELDAPLSGLQWTVDAYLVVLASLLLLAGSMGDRFGRRRVFQTGLVLFTLGSLLCSLAPSLGWLIVFRGLQAIGGSMLTPVAMSIITNTFTDARERAQAIGAWGSVAGISMALGPLVGGLLVDTIGWRSIFWINVPVGLIGALLTHLVVPESKAAVARRFDPVGQVLVVLALASATYGLIEGPATGWASLEILGLLCLAAVAVAALVVYERRREQPLIDVRFFRSVPFAGASVVAVLHFAALAALLFLNTLYLQQNRGYSALAAGALTLPLALAAVVASPLAGRLVGRIGVRVPMILAGSAVLVAGVLLSFLSGSTSLVLLAVAYAVFGLGHGLVNTPITNTAVSSMPKAQAGVASATTSAARQIGQVLGVAVAGTLTAGAAAQDPGFAEATHPAWWLVAVIGVVVAGTGVLTTTRWASRTAAPDAPVPVAA